MESGIQLMFDLSEVITFPKQTAGASVRPVRTSQSPGSARDLTETRAHSSERCFEFLASLKKNIDPNGLYKQAGNGVTVNVVQTIGEAIKEE